MTTAAVSYLGTDLARSIADKLIEFLETGHAPDGLFAPDVFLDLSVPQWRLQADNASDAIGIRVAGHAGPSNVARHRFDPTPTGFVLEFEERWTAGGQDWYCREMIRADICEAGITEFAIYCTGDWDEAQVAGHQASVTLIRP
jgi:hypothetical protein